MEVNEFSFTKSAAIDSLFSPAISSDSWVFYHATTSVAEERIDTTGLIPALDYDATLMELIKVFRAMNWAGESAAGYPVLKGFSFHRGTQTNLYFRESSTRSLTYAKPGFAGGETVRAIYHALNDLKRFAADSSIPERHYERQAAECKNLVQQGGCPTHVIRVDITWLLSRLRQFEEMGRQVAELRQSYRYGVVYAVRFDKDDVPFLNNCGGSGIVYSRPVAPGKIVGKARVYLDDQYFDLRRGAAGWQPEDRKSELSELLRRPPSTVGAADEYSVRERQCVVDAYAGPDDALDIARRWGTPDILRMIASGEIKFSEYL